MASQDVYVHKKGRDGVSALNPETPANESAVSPRMDLKNTVLLGYGATLAKRTFSTVTQEIRAGGNEETATALSNIGKGASMLVLAYATGGLSLIGNAIDGAATAITNYRQVQRENRTRDYNRELQGTRREFNTGGGVFD